MLRSMYDFEATYPKTLGFKMNEYFILHQTTTKHKNWWEVINLRGDMGFIPSNYVETVTVAPSFYTQCLDTIIDSLKENEKNSDVSISDRRDLLSRIKEMKRNAESNLDGDEQV